jgi:exosortase D (VPLPA-CTERM-specific)
MTITTQAAGGAPSGTLAVTPPVNPRGLFWFALAVVSTLPLFWFGFHGLATEWSRPEFSHGPVIPVLSFYMFLREMKFVPPPSAPVTDRWPGAALMIFALAVALAGNVARIDHLVFYALILWIGGLVLVGFGWKRGTFFWPSVLHLVFMLPLPYFLYFKINTSLQFVSSEIGVWFVALAGVPVFLEGNVIDLGVYKLQVAEACSGLRYLFPIMSFSYVFAVLYRGPVWHKIVLLLAAVPIAVLMNSFRIGVIGVMVDRYGIGQAEGFLHFFEGWIIFLSCIAILFGLAVLMRLLSGDRAPLGDAIDVDFTGLGAQLRRVATVAPSPSLTVAALATLALSAAWSFAPARETIRMERDPYSLFPMTLDDWSGTTTAFDPAIEANLGADDYLSGYFRNPDEAAGVDFFLSYYYSQIDGRSIHAPEICLPGGGWEIFSLNPVEVDLAGSRLGTVTLNRAVIQKGLEKQLVYYWFEGRGRRMSHDFLTRFRTVTDSMTLNRTDGGLVRVITPILPDEAEADADARARRFLLAAADRLHRFIPE